jgi:hypothetical protein
MKTVRYAFLFVAATAAGFAQQWEIGADAGASFAPSVTISGPAGSANAGLQTGFTGGVWLGQTISRHIGGEVRYNFMQNDLKLSNGGTTVTFGGQSHAIYYDLILRTSHRESRVQAFAAIGGGMRIFRGTGKEAASQPLMDYAYLTKTQTVKPMLSVGGGMKFKLAPRLSLRTEVRDFVTPFPKEVITPAPGMKAGRLLHDIVPMVGISYEY